MWDELILPLFIPYLIQGSTLICAFTECSGSILITERGGKNKKEAGMRGR